MRMTHFTRILSLLLTVVGFLVLFSLVLYLGAPGDRVPARLGGFLFNSFHLAGFYVPLYLILSGMFLLLPTFTVRRFLVLMGSLVPFLTLGILLKLVFNPGASLLEALLVSRLGGRGAAVLLMTLLLIEFLILLRLALGRPTARTDQGPVLSALASGKPSRLMEEDFSGAAASEREPGSREGGESPEPRRPEPRRPEPRRPEPRRPEPLRNRDGVTPADEDSLSSLFRQGVSPVLPTGNKPGLRVSYAAAGSEIPDRGGNPTDSPGHPSRLVSSPPPDQPSAAPAGEEPRERENLPESLVVDWEKEINPLPDSPGGAGSKKGSVPDVTAPSYPGDTDEEDILLDEPADEREPFEQPDDSVTEESGGDDSDDYPWDASLEEEEFEEPEEREDEEPGEPVFLGELDTGEESGVFDDSEDPPAEVLPEEPQGEEEITPAAVKAKPAAPSKPHPGDTSPDLPPKRGPAKRGLRRYDVPVDDILDEHADGEYWIVDDETRRASEILRLTLEEFKIAAEVTGISKGPVITMFEILPAPGVKLSKIVNLADNIALRLAASRVRIVAPIPGKHAVGIEVPNKDRAIVSFKEMLDDTGDNRKLEVPVILGKDITGGARIIDLVQTPHLLIAGATGSGKSVCVNSLICSILYKKKPDEVKLILIDPKIVELKLYNDIPHLLTPVITEPKKAFRALQYAIFEMERRYSLLDTLGVRDIRSYNRRVKEQKLATDPLAYIVIVVDEFADLMATTGKELESTIARLTAMSRAIGIHLVLATQRPSVDVITGLIKANIPSRIAFMVASKFDSRIIIDGVGAEKLLGKGDMLFTSSWDPNPVRIQGAFLSEGEAERVADHVKSLGEPDYIDEEIFGSDDDDDDFELMADTGDDPLLDTAVGIIVEAGKASASYLQRRLKIGYNRAARLVEEMERRGIVGPANGSKPRDILHIPDRLTD